MTAQETFNVWPDGTPDDNGHDNTSTLTVYHPAKGVENTGKAVVICPGGGYEFLAMDHEGHEIAQLMAQNGVTAAVLKYRLPHGNRLIPAEDAREALRIMRRNARYWGIDSAKVGIAGSSAGGHLASTVSVHHVDKAGTPSFSILFYPVISTDPKITHHGSINNLLGNMAKDSDMLDFYSNDKHVDANTPPTIIVVSGDDTTVPVANSLRYYQALSDNKVPAEMHVYPSGEHGWGMHDNFRYHDVMTKSLVDWVLNLELNNKK